MDVSAPKFVVLHHTFDDAATGQDHFDLMLQRESGLWTWRLQHWPPPASQTACRLADHRLDYLHYQGTVSGDRGRVVRVDWGTYRAATMEPGNVQVTLAGQQVQGQLRLQSQSDQCWKACWSG